MCKHLKLTVLILIKKGPIITHNRGRVFEHGKMVAMTLWSVKEEIYVLNMNENFEVKITKGFLYAGGIFTNRISR